MGKTHDVVGLTTAVGVGYATGIGLPATGVLAVAALAGSRLPDDLEGGFLPHRGITHRVWFVGVVAVVVWLAVFGLWNWGWFQDHVLTYGETEGTSIDGLGMAIGLLLAGGIAIGYAMHLVADMCTIHGLDVGKKKNGKPRRVHLLPERFRIRTDGVPEHMLRLGIYTAWVGIPALLIFGCGGTSAASSNACSAANDEALAVAKQYVSDASHLGSDKLSSTGGATAQVRVRFTSEPEEKPITVDLRCEAGVWHVSEAQQAAW